MYVAILCLVIQFFATFNVGETLPFNPSDSISYHTELFDIYMNECKKHIPTLRFEFVVLIAVYLNYESNTSHTDNFGII